MSMSGAGGNRQRQLIALIGPWSLLNDDFGPYRFPGAWTKANFQTEGNGAGYNITIYDGISQTIDNFVIGTYYPTLGIYNNPHPPPPIPTAAYGALAQAAGVVDTVWNKSLGPSLSTGTVDANPMIPNGTNASTFIMNYPSVWVRVKVTAIAGATGSVKIWMLTAP